jgi:hypothetical protein
MLDEKPVVALPMLPIVFHPDQHPTAMKPLPIKVKL